MKDTIIGVSGSYNFEDNYAQKVSSKFMKDFEEGSKLQTIPIYRTKFDGIDNLKFMYPIAGIPIFAYTLLNAVDQNVEVRATGNEEIGDLVDLMNDELNLDIKFKHEGKDLSLSNSFLKLFSDDIGKKNYFVSGDIPLATDYISNNYTGDVVIDLNVKELLDPFNHTSRNFYNEGKINQQISRFKEGNIYFMSETGFDKLNEAANIFFRNRKNGGLITAVGEYFKTKYQSDEMFKKGLLKNKFLFAKEIGKVFFQRFNIPVPALNFNRLNKVISEDFFDIDWRFEFIHDDVFRLLDIDGLNNDYTLYDGITKNIERQGMLDERLIQVREGIKDNKNKFPVVNNFESIIYEYIQQVNEHLDDNFKFEFVGIDNFINKYQNNASIDELTNHFLKKKKM